MGTAYADDVKDASAVSCEKPHKTTLTVSARPWKGSSRRHSPYRIPSVKDAVLSPLATLHQRPPTASDAVVKAIRIDAIASHQATIQHDCFPGALFPFALSLLARCCRISPVELAVLGCNGSGNIEDDYVGKAGSGRDIRSRAVQRASQVRCTAANWYGTRDRVFGVESVVTLDPV